MLESFAFNIDKNFEMQMTEKQLASRQNRRELTLSQPVQTIIREAVMQNKTLELMASITAIQTGVIPSNYRSARAKQATLYKNHLLDLAGDQCSNNDKKVFSNFVKENFDGLNRLAFNGDSNLLHQHLENMEPVESSIIANIRDL